MYSNQINYQHLSDDSEVNMVTSNVSRNRIIHEANSNEAGHLENEYGNGGNIQIINYLPTDMLHHQMLQGMKKLDGIYKDELHGDFEGGDGTSTTIITQSQVQSSQLLPVLTPIKYNEYHNNIVSEIITEESEKSDCDSGEHELHKTPSKLPHKKRIAKKLNSSQPPYNQEQFSIIIPNEESNIRNLQTTTNHFECNICGVVMLGQLDFFMHLKQHYEPPVMQSAQVKRKEVQIRALAQDENILMDMPVPINSLREKMHEVLDYSQEGIIKNEVISREQLPEIDEFDEFSEPEDMMNDDLRKGIDKVVETIDDNECLPEATWNYQVTEEIEPTEEHSEELQLYAENLIQNNASSSIETTFDEIDNADNSAMVQGADDFDSEDEEDNTPLEEVRRSLQKPSTTEVLSKKFDSDKEDIELTECLKKIHNFKCTSCNKAFNSRTALGYHLKTHTTERRYVCDQCGKKFLTNGALKVHQRLHTDDRPYECKFPDCGKSFRQWGDLKYHETSIHSDKKDHVCEFCAKAFARKYSLVIHRRIHTGERNYKCSDCDKSFRASSYLLNHKRIHTGEKPYTCTVLSCQKKFRVVGDLKRHMKIHDRSKGGGQTKDRKKEVAAVVKKKEPIRLDIPLKTLTTNDECVDLSIKDELREKDDLVYSTNEIDIYAKRGRSEVITSKVDSASPKGKKSMRNKKSK